MQCVDEFHPLNARIGFGQFDPVSAASRVTLTAVDDPGDPLLGRIYTDLLRPSFPDPNDLDKYDDLRRYFAWNGRPGRPTYCVRAAFAGTDLAGATVYSLFVIRDLTFMKAEYTAVAKAWRKLGVAATLCRAREQHAFAFAERHRRQLDFSLIYLVDPALVPANLRSDYDPSPEALNIIWRRMGHFKLDFPFVQLPLSNAHVSTTYLRLWIKPWSPRFVGRREFTAREMKAVLAAANYYRVSRGQLCDYVEYRQMLSHLKSMKYVSLDVKRH